jgi:photosystem II stability/assembly factor-like uncharacterized protein
LIAAVLAALAAAGCQSDGGPESITPERSIAGRMSAYDPNRRIARLPEKIHFFDDRRGLMATHDGRRFATNDGGATWHRAGRISPQRDLLGRSLPRAGIIDVEFVDRLHGWAASGFRVFRTVDGGKTWRGLQLDCEGDAVQPAIADIAFVDRRRGFALCKGQPGAGQQLKVLYATADGGDTWVLRTGWRKMPSVGYAEGLDFQTADEGLMTTARYGIHRTSNGGRTWPLALATYDWTPLATAWPSQRRIYAALWRIGLVRSDDGGRRWRQFYPPPPGPPVGPMSFSSGARGIGAGIGGLFRNPGAILRTQDSGRSWAEWTRLHGLDIRQFERVSPTTVWAVASRLLPDGGHGRARIFRSSDDGRTWIPLRAPRAAFGTLSLVSNRIAFLAANHGLFRTVDVGSTWRRVGRRELYGARFLSEDRGFAVESDHVVLRTEDGGRSWERLAARGLRVFSISAFPPNHVWLTGNACRRFTCRGRILRSSDGGRTWEEIRFRKAVPPAASQWLDARRGFALFGGEGGHYRTADGGRTWRFVEPR